MLFYPKDPSNKSYILSKSNTCTVWLFTLFSGLVAFFTFYNLDWLEAGGAVEHFPNEVLINTFSNPAFLKNCILITLAAIVTTRLVCYFIKPVGITSLITAVAIAFFFNLISISFILVTGYVGYQGTQHPGHGFPIGLILIIYNMMFSKVSYPAAFIGTLVFNVLYFLTKKTGLLFRKTLH